MWRVSGRPMGVWVLTAVVVADGLGFLGAAYTFLMSPPVDWFAAVGAAAIGMLLLFKAHGLWSFHHTAWLVVLVLNALGAAIGAAEMVRGHAEPGAWGSLGWAILTVAYLCHPSIRVLFAHPGGLAPAQRVEAERDDLC